jgi:hypothetical protein
MTSIIHDFDAIRARQPSAALTEETPHLTAPAALIAEMEAAFDRACPALAEAEKRERGWRAENPDAPRGRDALPAAIARARDEAEELEAAAVALTDRVLRWVPDNLADAIYLLEWSFETGDPEGMLGGGLAESLLAGLRIIAAAGDPAAAAPVDGDRRILGLFREWATAWRKASDAADDEMQGKFLVV